jgi:hypothetical protein
MSAGQFVGRVGGIAAALGVGVAILNGSAVAAADNDGADTSSRGGASAGASQSDSAPASRVASRKPAATQDSSSAPSRGRAASSATDLTVSLPDLPSPSALTGLGGGSAAPAALTVPAPAASVPAPSAAVTVPAPSVNAPAPSAALPAATGPVALGVTQTYATTPPSPTATTTTPYGVLGQWMVNKNGQVADWVGQPYCGKGSTAANCKPDTPGAKIMQEPINTIFVVKAPTLYQAEQNLNWAITISGFGSTPFSSIGYSGIVGTKSYKQFPRSGPLGLGLIGPLPFLKFQNGLIGSLLGIGPAYRDAPFWAANNHLRTFGGEPDGKGNFIFTASVSRENLDTTGGGLLPGHGFESYNVARQALVDKMVKASWISFASNMNLVQMNNAIDPNDPKYTTGDADGLAQVIGIGSLFGSAPVRSSATTRVA